MPRQFAKEFDPKRGDLVYGRSDVRDKYDKTLSKDQLDAIEAGAWARIDVYNNASVVAGVQNAAQSNVRDQTLEFARDADQGTGPKDVERYASEILGSRYSPERVMTAPPDKLDRELSSRPDAKHEWLAIRRACKFGIEYVVRIKGKAHIHFLLDEIDMADVVRKAKFQGSGRRGPVVPITTSELRAIYRNWHRPEYAQGVIFYMAGEEVPAPWTADTRLWDEYGLARMEKYRDILLREMKKYSEQNSANKKLLSGLKAKQTETEKTYLNLKKFRRYNEAVLEIQKLIREIAPGALQPE